MKPMVWTIRLADEREPFFWLTHDGRASATVVDQVVTKMTTVGYTVVVGFKSSHAPTGIRRGAR